MLKVGITGGIGSGKSTVCRVLEVFGIPVFYSDKVGKELLNEEPIQACVIGVFGKEVLGPSGINRKALAKVVFNDRSKLKALEAIIHPEVRARFLSWADAQRQVPFVAQEAAVMIESGGHKFVDHLVAVEAPVQVRLQRVMARDKVDKEQVLARINAQMTADQRAEYANTIINNDGVQLVIPQVISFYNKLKRA